MKWIIYIVFSYVFSVSCGAFAQQEQYKTHYVEQGETVYSIAKKYNISEETIYTLNPSVRNGINSNAILIIPNMGIRVFIFL